MADEFILRMANITKTFPGVVALDDVKLDVRAGTVHALMGENGAGKSTLMKVLIGMYQKDSGTVTLEGREVEVHDTKGGLNLGISMIHQELSPVPEMTVAENIYLGREPLNRFKLVDKALMRRMAQELFDEWNIPLNPGMQMKALTVASMQLVEIAKAISYDAKVIIMDEPTSAITEREVDLLFAMIRRLRDRGTAIIYISHKMDEIFQIADEVTIFRDGQWVLTQSTAEMTQQSLITAMVGRELTQMFPKEHAEIGEVLLEVKNLNRGRLVKDVSFTLRRGEILGLAGLVGAGRTEVLETIFGVHRAESGEILVDGKPVQIKQPKDAINAGMALLTEDRRATGIMGVLSVRDNMLAAALRRYSPGGFVDAKRLEEAAEEQRKALAIKTPSLDQLIKNLSGGNQQKVLVSRWLLTLPDILMIDEPTRGIDVGAKSEIHRLISTMAKEGKAILMVSSEMPEILGMSDRVLVMHEGEVTGEVPRAEATQDKIMQLATGTEAAA
ncbi:sugar ABC transporter ATP-binding protein [Actinotalea sp. M2MS4P-6]|uniref:sugar ABC transporter ATP-binding protein n=1 Tax=Actinotalea sp. M2MS4P-6 TaxID=2983762 RepID=UPI0021E4E458|nr:sugar ABC transporter ATP-binding protein [Actinotalea sp. M2MS4P-6]MCV2395030.1 sugar ABC transporter ATP-binding protein [Actinotalea sp. M2MS4P-6]